MNKAELTEKLIERTGLSARDARAAIDAIFDPDPAIGLIAAALVAGRRSRSAASGPSKRGDARLARDAIRTPGRRSTSPRRGLRRSRPESRSRKR